MRSVLIVGGDGLIGHALYKAYKATGVQVFITSRKGTAMSVQLDLSHTIDVRTLPRCDVVYLCAAISRFVSCEQNLLLAQRVNVLAQLELAEYFLSIGSHVVFVSSNAVFDGKEEAPNEDAWISPTSLYGQLKAEVEEGLETLSRQYNGYISIVRLSKVLSNNLPLIADWLDNLRAGKTISAFPNMTLSPISLDYAVKGLVCCGAGRHQGKFHLSGEIELSYHELAKVFAIRVGANQHLVLMKTAHQLFRHNRLGMSHTELILSIKPQNINSLLTDILKP